MNTVVAQPSMVLGRFRKLSLSAPVGVWRAFLCWVHTISLGWVGGIPSVFGNLSCRNGWYKCWQTSKWLSGQPPWYNQFLLVCGYCRTADESKPVPLWLLYLCPCLPSPLQKRDLSLEDRTESWFCAEWASDSKPWAVFTVLGVFLWSRLCKLAISWLSRICCKESIACARSELFSNPAGVPNRKSAARAEFTPKVREGERISHDSTSCCCD